MSSDEHESVARTLAQITEGDRLHVQTDRDAFAAVATQTHTDDADVRVTVVPTEGDDWIELRAIHNRDDWQTAVYRLQYPDDDWTKHGTLHDVTIDE